MDSVVGLPEFDGFEEIRFIVHRLLKKRPCIPCHMMIDALGLAEMFLWEVVRLHGLALTIILDRSRHSASIFLHQICSRLGIDRMMSTAFNQQTVEPTERMNTSMTPCLRVVVNHPQHDWVKFLRLAECAVNIGSSETTQCYVFYAVQGVNPRMRSAWDQTNTPDEQCGSADNVPATQDKNDEHIPAKITQSQVV